MLKDMTPQPYPLGCTTEDRTRYLVLGWTPEDYPIVVIDSPSIGNPKPSIPTALVDVAVRCYLPATSVSIDGDISATVDGQVSTTVEGTKSNGGLLVYGPND